MPAFIASACMYSISVVYRYGSITIWLKDGSVLLPVLIQHNKQIDHIAYSFVVTDNNIQVGL